jgi:hypothetical protein
MRHTLLAMLLLGCVDGATSPTADTDAPAADFVTPARFTEDVDTPFDTEGCEGCGPGMVTLCPDGTAEWVPDDILEDAFWQLEEDEISLNLDGAEVMVWTLDGDDLVSLGGTRWIRASSPPICR